MKLKYLTEKIRIISLLKYTTIALIFVIFPMYKSSAYQFTRDIINNDEVSLEIKKIYNLRCTALKTGDYSTLNNYYDTSKPSGNMH